MDTSNNLSSAIPCAAPALNNTPNNAPSAPRVMSKTRFDVFAADIFPEICSGLTLRGEVRFFSTCRNLWALSKSINSLRMRIASEDILPRFPNSSARQMRTFDGSFRELRALLSQRQAIARPISSGDPTKNTCPLPPRAEYTLATNGKLVAIPFFQENCHSVDYYDAASLTLKRRGVRRVDDVLDGANVGPRIVRDMHFLGDSMALAIRRLDDLESGLVLEDIETGKESPQAIDRSVRCLDVSPGNDHEIVCGFDQDPNDGGDAARLRAGCILDTRGQGTCTYFSHDKVTYSDKVRVCGERIFSVGAVGNISTGIHVWDRRRGSSKLETLSHTDLVREFVVRGSRLIAGQSAGGLSVFDMAPALTLGAVRSPVRTIDQKAESLFVGLYDDVLWTYRNRLSAYSWTTLEPLVNVSLKDRRGVVQSPVALASEQVVYVVRDSKLQRLDFSGKSLEKGDRKANG